MHIRNLMITSRPVAHGAKGCGAPDKSGSKLWNRPRPSAQTWLMQRAPLWKFFILNHCVVLACVSGLGLGCAQAAIFNVKDYGASGKKSEDARPAIQKTIEACAAGGGGTVLLPRGEYTSGTLHLRSRVRLEIGFPSLRE